MLNVVPGHLGVTDQYYTEVRVCLFFVKETKTVKCCKQNSVVETLCFRARDLAAEQKPGEAL